MDLIISLVSILITYKLFEEYGLSKAAAFRIIINLVILIINGSFISMYNNGIVSFLIYLFIVIIVNYALTAIEYWAYNKTNSFFTFFLLAGIVEVLSVFGIAFLLSLIFAFIIFK